MTFHIWRLSEASEDNLGLACTAAGLLLGRTHLVERHNEGFIVREPSEIERLLRHAFKSEPPIGRIMPGLATVARALNADDQCLARIAAVHLRIPDLPSKLTRSEMEAEDRLIKYARDEAGETPWDPAKHPRTGTSPNPGWFAPTDGESSESLPTHTAQNDDPTRRSDASPGVRDDWVRLQPGPKRIDELADFIEWIANARPEDEQSIRAEIKRYFADAGVPDAAAALNSHLTVLLRPGITREQRQRILDLMDVYTRVDPAEYARNRDWITGAAIAAGGVPPAARGEASAARGAAEAEGAGAEASAANAPSEVWKQGWAKRGTEIHERFSDGSLGPHFPTIDMIPEGVATSIKSIDLNAATYQDAARLTNRINKYVDDLSEFDGATWGTDVVKSSDIKSRTLHLIVPSGSITEAQQKAIAAAQERARSMNSNPVNIVVTEF